MSDQITVTQEHGQDSIVEVSEEMRDGYPSPVRLLHFYTSQSLTSQSGRAWNVYEAIKSYCRERGYSIIDSNQHSVTAQYDPRAHSQQAWYELREQIQSDPRYSVALTYAKEDAAKVQATFGPVISQVKNLLHALEHRTYAEYKEIQECLAQVQHEVLDDKELPTHLNNPDRESLERPLYQLAFDHYQRYGDGLPDDLDSILGLLD